MIDFCQKYTIRVRVVIALFIVIFCLASCTSKVLKAENAQEILKNEEFDKQFDIQEMPVEIVKRPSGTYVLQPGPDPDPSAWPKSELVQIKNQQEPKPVKSQVKLRTKNGELITAATVAPAPSPISSTVLNPSPTPGVSPTPQTSTALVPDNKELILSATPHEPSPHEPSIEDSEGFDGRRPKIDPYRVNEKVTLDVSYFGVSAGTMTLEVRPFAIVNGRKSYHIAGTAHSTSVFAMFYAVDDWFESFVDYETLVPSSYALHVKESKQLRETRCLFDWDRMLAIFWDKKINAEQKVEEKKFEWSMVPYAQNIFTAFSYLRNFQLKVGKKIVYRVSHEKENFDITGEVIRKEKISTPIGELDTVVVKPHIHLNGVFRPVGDVFIWLTDDDRKFVVRIESKIKIGTIVASLKAIEPGQLQ